MPSRIRPLPPKSGVYENSGTIVWTVSLSRQIAPFDEEQNAPQYTTGFLFCDELTAKQTYVDNSLTLKVGSQQTHPAVQVDGQTLRVTLDQPLSQDAVITYKTIPSPRCLSVTMVSWQILPKG